MTGEPSGVDLARQALLAAQEAARKNGAGRATKTKPKRRTTTVVPRDGREPLGLDAAISMMMTERGLAAPAAGGSVLAHFDTILATAVPQLAGRVKAVAFDADTGRLDIAPDAPAVGTKLRWSAPKLIAAANEQVPKANVRVLHVLAPAAARTSLTASAAVAPASGPAALAERRASSDGYRTGVGGLESAGAECSAWSRRVRLRGPGLLGVKSWPFGTGWSPALATVTGTAVPQQTRGVR
ncbi:DUF721 domain-containing protein [Streptomyces sp. NPDC020875]|uniref:DciA family protein n=1 Tax=Streptomyces sp. NPDC020875 TaxID=3154898 RepID=UPI0034060665